MKFRRGVGVLLALSCFLTCSLGNTEFNGYATEQIPTSETVYASGQNAERYYYVQLKEEAKSFYDAMYAMYEEGMLKTGTEDYDLVANGHVTQEQLEGYASGNMTLLSYMGAARDAFYADYPDIFYVDFSHLSLRVTQKGSEYRAYLGTGRSDNYYVKGFTSKDDVEAASAEYESRINSIVEGAGNVTAEEDENLIEKRVKYVHDEIIWNTSYRLEDTCKEENIGHVRTVYGALVKGESLCEGYSRAMKAVLDRLGISCVLVQGGFQMTSDCVEPHMWNYVQIDGEWYGVDATIDDPVSKLPGEGGKDGFENSEYLLVGDDVMGRRHTPDGVMSEANYEFEYPAIAGQGKMFKDVADTNGLKVSYGAGTDGELQVGVFKISYNNMGAAKTIENGKYMLMREAKFNEKTNLWEYSDWAYMFPEVYMIHDTDTELTLEFPSTEYIEFAVTSAFLSCIGKADLSI